MSFTSSRVLLAAALLPAWVVAYIFTTIFLGYGIFFNADPTDKVPKIVALVLLALFSLSYVAVAWSIIRRKVR